jgi:hypothetical protein
MAFMDRPLAEVFAALERRFGIQVSVAPTVAVGDTITWIRPRLERAEEALVDLCALAACRYEPTPQGFHVRWPPPPPDD